MTPQLGADKEYVGVQYTSFINQGMGPDVSEDSLPPNLHVDVVTAAPVPVVDHRAESPTDIQKINTPTMEESLRRRLRPDEEWPKLETAPTACFPVEPVIVPQMVHFDPVAFTAQIAHPSRDNASNKASVDVQNSRERSGTLNDERALNTLGGSLTFSPKTGPKKDSQRSIAALAITARRKVAQDALRRLSTWAARWCAFLLLSDCFLGQSIMDRH